MNKLFCTKLAGIVLVLFLAGCGGDDDETNKVALKSITVEPATTVSLVIGETQQLTATAVPANASDVKFVWTTAVATVATVSDNGLVTAVGAGTTAVTVTSGSIKTDVTVTVTAAVPDLESFTVTPASLNLLVSDDPVQLTVTKTPANAGASFTWKSGNSSVVTVSDAGLVTAVGSGSTTITVASGDLEVTVPVGVARQVVSLDYSWAQGSIEVDANAEKGFFTAIITDPPSDPQFFSTGLSEALEGTSGKVIFECITNRPTNTYEGEHNAEIDEYNWADWLQIYFLQANWTNIGVSDFNFIPKCDDWTEFAFDIPSEIYTQFGAEGDFLRIDPVGRGGNWNSQAIVGYEITIRNLRIVTY
jgi:hypothetical protein